MEVAFVQMLGIGCEIAALLLAWSLGISRLRGAAVIAVVGLLLLIVGPFLLQIEGIYRLDAHHG